MTANRDSNWGATSFTRWRGHRLLVRQLGSINGPPLLLLHGFAAASGHWRGNAGGFAAAGWCVYGLDLLGFGASDQPFLVQDNRTWCLQVSHLIEQHIGQPTVIVGHSLGGLVGLTTAALQPELVRALVAAPLQDPALLQRFRTPRTGPGPLPAQPPSRPSCQWLVAQLWRWLIPWWLIVRVFSSRPVLRWGLTLAYANRDRLDRHVEQLIARPARRPGAGAALAGMSLGMGFRPPGATAPVLLNRLSCPLLVLWGERDRLAPIAATTTISRYGPAAEIQVAAGLGHCPHDEAPDVFNATVLGWLQSRLVPPG